MQYKQESVHAAVKYLFFPYLHQNITSRGTLYMTSWRFIRLCVLLSRALCLILAVKHLSFQSLSAKQCNATTVCAVPRFLLMCFNEGSGDPRHPKNEMPLYTPELNFPDEWVERLDFIST